MLTPADTESTRQHPQQLVPGAKPIMQSSSSRTGQHCELVAQEQVLENEVLAWASHGSEGSEQQPEEFDHVHSILHLPSRGVLPPHNLSLNQIARTFESVTGKTGKKRHVPLGLMKLLSVALRPVQPAIARQIQAGVIMDTCDMTCDRADWQRHYPSIKQTSLAEMVRRDYVRDSVPSLQV